MIRAGLEDPEIRVGHRLALSQRAEKMGAASSCTAAMAEAVKEMQLLLPKKPPEVFIQGRSLPGDNAAGYKRAFLSHESSSHPSEGAVSVCSVEELVLGHFREQGYTEGLHREGTVVNTLFGLFFWDVIYAPVADVFRSPHQAAPLDLDYDFYETRKDLMEARLAEMRTWSDTQAEEELQLAWGRHHGRSSVVSWDVFRDAPHAASLVRCLGLGVVAGICERLAKDHRFTRSGFPDLVVWQPEARRARVVEVKGPNDRLSTKQILWIEFLIAAGATAEVCHVQAVGQKKIQRSPRKSPLKKSPVKSPKASPAKSPTKGSPEDKEDKAKGRKRRTPKPKDDEGDAAAATAAEGPAPKRRRGRKESSEDPPKRGRPRKQQARDKADIKPADPLCDDEAFE